MGWTMGFTPIRGQFCALIDKEAIAMRRVSVRLAAPRHASGSPRKFELVKKIRYALFSLPPHSAGPISAGRKS
jgi:hypothetical protein